MSYIWQIFDKLQSESWITDTKKKALDVYLHANVKSDVWKQVQFNFHIGSHDKPFYKSLGEDN